MGYMKRVVLQSKHSLGLECAKNFLLTFPKHKHERFFFSHEVRAHAPQVGRESARLSMLLRVRVLLLFLYT